MAGERGEGEKRNSRGKKRGRRRGRIGRRGWRRAGWGEEEDEEETKTTPVFTQ